MTARETSPFYFSVRLGCGVQALVSAEYRLSQETIERC